MKEPYEKPELHMVLLSGVTGRELAALSDEELAEKLHSAEMKEARKLYRVSSAVPMREIAGAPVIVPTADIGGRRADMGMPNETFQFLFEQFAQPKTVGDVVLAAERVYRAGREQIERDVRRFVAESLKAGFLEEV